ncbi:MAG: hypothetical protein HKN24_10555 [Acidimicrobiales bacterium]|nr:hypothetical protein [Acidimicrobiales bacterium]
MNDTKTSSTGWIAPSIPPPRVGAESAPPTRLPTGDNARSKRRSRSPESRLPTPARIRVEPWRDDLIADATPLHGFYAQRYYGPIVGPSCLLLLRTLASQLDVDRDGFVVDAAELAARIGCSARAGGNSQFWKALRRGVRFGLIRQVEDRVLIRHGVGPLSHRLSQRLPPELRREHRVWIGTDEPSPTRLLDGTIPTVPLSAIETLRLAARGLCTPDELRTLDRAHKLT